MTRLHLASLLFGLGLWSCGWIGIDLLPGVSPGECPGGGPPTGAGVCGCGIDDPTDSDGDGVLDCVDFCPDQRELRLDGSCGCSAAVGDEDGDGVPNCQDQCPFDDSKSEFGMCGCGVDDVDSDLDGTSDCMDECPNAPGKIRPGTCGCEDSDADTDLDGTFDCMDACTGGDDSDYVADASCGMGYCRDYNLPSTCVAGLETACQPAAPLSSSDATCDGVDDDCDGTADEEFTVAATSCGLGVCASTGLTACDAGIPSDTCRPDDALALDDDTCDGVDDDCDGTNDDDVAPVDSTCGAGSCGTMGVIACVEGQSVDSCMPSGMTSPDVTCNNIDEDCDGVADDAFVPTMSMCGLGACARSGMLTCTSGSLVDSCMPGTAGGSDSSCDAVDDDCDGRVDEHYVSMPTSCGVGACASSGTRTCVGGTESDSCVERSPATSSDDAFAPGNGIDDDCDGRVDEDVPACTPTTRMFEAGAHMNIAVPGNCHNLTVRLWGGGGGGGDKDALAHAAGGRGGPGGYAQAQVLVATPIHLYVGGGAASGCNAAGTNAGSSSYNGGTGGATEGANGADGVVAGGGNGGNSSAGYDGGRGYFGGGGGGEGNTSSFTSGNGGGGGAASVLIMNGLRAGVAGGGGGGGGGASLVGTGGPGGSGCGAAGLASTSDGGGGGGGGTCEGGDTRTGSGADPAFSGDIPSGRGRAGNAQCGAGGAGYAILTFSP